MRNVLLELHSRNRNLAVFGWINVALAVVFLLLWTTTQGTITGINAWIKPLKFALSIALYSFTFGWLLHWLKNQRQQRWLSGTLMVCMAVELLIIAGQAARGETSHYNTSSLLNGILFGTMGVFIGINTVMNAVVWALFMLPGRTTLQGAQLMAWRTGLFFFFAGSLAGGLMIRHTAHSIGVPDGGPGIPFFNWSTQGGDLRIPHFFTLHGLQIVPVLWWWIGRHSSHPRVLTLGFILVFAFLSLLLHVLALKGIPLLGS